MSELPEKLLRISEVEAATGFDRSTIYRKIKADPPEFPLPVQLSTNGRCVAWKASEVATWIEERAKEGRKEWLANRPKAQAAARSRRANVGGGQ